MLFCCIVCLALCCSSGAYWVGNQNIHKESTSNSLSVTSQRQADEANRAVGLFVLSRE